MLHVGARNRTGVFCKYSKCSSHWTISLGPTFAFDALAQWHSLSSEDGWGWHLHVQPVILLLKPLPVVSGEAIPTLEHLLVSSPPAPSPYFFVSDSILLFSSLCPSHIVVAYILLCFLLMLSCLLFPGSSRQHRIYCVNHCVPRIQTYACHTIKVEYIQVPSSLWQWQLVEILFQIYYLCVSTGRGLLVNPVFVSGPPADSVTNTRGYPINVNSWFLLQN